jgi:hypothetical protein
MLSRMANGAAEVHLDIATEERIYLSLRAVARPENPILDVVAVHEEGINVVQPRVLPADDRLCLDLLQEPLVPPLCSKPLVFPVSVVEGAALHDVTSRSIMPNKELETAALNRVLEWLGEQGQSAAIASRPDDDRVGKPQVAGRKTPDAVVLLDGREVLIDLAELHQNEQSVRQHKAVAQLVNNLETRMRLAVRQAGLGHVVARASFAELPARKDLLAAEQQIFDAMVGTFRGLRAGNEVWVEGVPSWVDQMYISLASNTPGFSWFFDDQMHGGFVVGILVESLDRILKKKRLQLEGAAEGWLIVIERTFLANDEDFAQAIPLLTEPIPSNWTRIILVRPWSDWRVSEFRVS